MTRLTLALLLCFALSGCAVGIVASGLENIGSESQDEKFLRSLDYHVTDSSVERGSWIATLENFTRWEDISGSGICSPKDRPLLCIDSREKQSTILNYLSIASFMLSFFSFAVIPGDMVGTFQTTFDLHVPGKAPVHTEYTYNKHLVSWLPFAVAPDFRVFFTAFSTGNQEGHKLEREEKRRLLLRFLRDTQRDFTPAKP